MAIPTNQPRWKAVVLLSLLTLFFLPTLSAQPGGPGGPGGGPGGRPPSGERPRPGQRPSGRDWNRMGDDQNAQQVKQKKKVREGSTFKVVGSLRDSVTGEFLPFVNVAVLDSVDSSLVKGGTTNLDGLFEISGIPAGGMLLRVSAIGYRNILMPFHVSNNTALGTIRLKPGATTLDAVTITAEKPLYAMDGEKMVYNVSEDPSIQTGTTEDALQNAPGVEVDVEGNVTLRGVSSVEIWINDKPSKLTEENLKTYLQTLPANALARIETITNPSAKYATDAEAVINIVTSAHIKSNQFVSFGVNGSNQPFVSPWVSYMWAKERLSVNLFASGRYSRRENSSDGWSLTRDSSLNDVYRDTNSSRSVNSSLGANIFMNVNYEIDSTSDISFDGGFNYNGRGSDDSTFAGETFYRAIGDSLLRYHTGDTTDSRSFFGHIGADYTKKFDQKGHNLRIGINSRISNNSSEEQYDRTYRLGAGTDEQRMLLSNSHSAGASLDVRYNRPCSDDGEMSYGIRADYETDHETFDRYRDFDQTIVDALRTYKYEGTETSVDADVNWTHRWGGFTAEVGLGLGLEHDDYNYSDNPYADKGDTLFFTARPSVHLSYRTESMHNFKLNYSLRMRNPSISNLTKFRTYGENSYSTGNPGNLSSSLTHNAEAGWQKFFERFGNVGVEAYARLSDNEISSLTESKFDEALDRMVRFSKPYNMGSSWRYGASVNMTYRPTGFFNVRLYANLYNYGYHLDNYRGQSYTDDKWSWSARINAWAKVWNQYQVTASLNYTSPTISLMSERKARYSFNMGVRSDFFKRKLSVFVNVQDLFNWGGRYGSGSENTNPFYLSESTQKMLNSRYVSAGITLRFGKMELEKTAKDGSSEAGDSL